MKKILYILILALLIPFIGESQEGVLRLSSQKRLIWLHNNHLTPSLLVTNSDRVTGNIEPLEDNICPVLPLQEPYQPTATL